MQEPSKHSHVIIVNKVIVTLIVSIECVYEGHSVFFGPRAFKAKCTTLILVECITFHKTNLFDDVQ